MKVDDTFGEYGEKLKSLRIEKKLTQKEIADRIGLVVSAVSSYEFGMHYLG